VGCGADELIDLLMRVTLEPGDTILDCSPTFGMYSFDAAVNNAKAVDVPRLVRARARAPAARVPRRWRGAPRAVPRRTSVWDDDSSVRAQHAPRCWVVRFRTS
jgi:aspartate/methionine/tyrosine aminotransferase